jgi:hypothetical protein
MDTATAKRASAKASVEDEDRGLRSLAGPRVSRVESAAQQRLAIGPKGGGHGVAPTFSTYSLVIVETNRTRIVSGSRAIVIPGDPPL